MIEDIIDYLDNNDYMKQFIEDAIQENYDCGGAFNFDLELRNFLKSDKDISELSEDDFEIVLNAVRKNINDKTYEKIRLQAEADDRSNYYSDYGYDDKSSAFWHLFEKYLAESYEYNKLISDCYREYLEEKRVK